MLTTIAAENAMSIYQMGHWLTPYNCWHTAIQWMEEMHTQCQYICFVCVLVCLCVILCEKEKCIAMVIFMALSCKTWTFHQFIWWKSFNPRMQTLCVKVALHWWQQNFSHYPMLEADVLVSVFVWPPLDRCFAKYFKWVDWWI